MRTLKQYQSISTSSDSIEYSTLLHKNGIEFIKQGMYLLSPGLTPASGWILHVSFVEPDIIIGLEKIIDILKHSDIKWKLVRDSNAAKTMLDGKAGNELIGKVLSIYSSEANLISISEELIKRTSGMKGPFVPTDAHLGGCVYTRYGGFVAQEGVDSAGNKFWVRMNNLGIWEKDPKPIPFKKPGDVIWPFAQSIAPLPEMAIPSKYELVETIAHRGKGNVVLLRNLEIPQDDNLCILKQGRKYMWFDRHGRDMTDRIRKQVQIHSIVKNCCRVPDLVEAYSNNGDEYLVCRFIKGRSLSTVIEDVHKKGETWEAIHQNEREQLWAYFIDICLQVKNLHNISILHRDISPENFLIDYNDIIWLIDFEMEEEEEIRKGNKGFKLGTPGFMSDNLENDGVAQKEDDIYALGAVLFYMLTGILPTAVDLSNIPQIYKILEDTGVSEIEINLLTSFISKSTEERSLQFESFVTTNNIQLYYPSISKNKIKTKFSLTAEFVQNSIDALATDIYWFQDHYWKYIIPGNNSSIGTNNTFPHGLAGTLYMLGEVKRMGYSIKKCEKSIFAAVEAIMQQSMACNFNEPTGLLTGSAGYLLGMASISHSGYKEYTFDAIQLLLSKMSLNIQTFDIATGQSGIGLACFAVENTGFDKVIGSTAEIFRKITQLPLENDLIYDSNETVLNFFTGVTGILFFQASVANYVGDSFSIAILKKRCELWANCFEQMLKVAKSDTVLINNGSRMETILWGCQLCLLLSENKIGYRYQILAIDAIKLLPHKIVNANISTRNGLPLMGHTFLDLYVLTGDEEYIERARWIAQHLTNLAKFENNFPYWSDYHNPPSPDFMNGTSGIIYFLSRITSCTFGNSPLRISEDKKRSFN